MNVRLKRFVLLTLAAVLLVVVAPLQRALNHDREALGLTRVAPLENAPPVLAFTTVALGGFRGLIANALWIRASELQEEDKFFEMQQLADWITKLEPHYTQVWLVQAWNMAYNISVKFKENGPADFSDRWRWVRGGIELLRDQGLKYNPNDVLIFRELSWFFQHKMGANLDDANMYYKRMWAKEMSRVFGEKNLNLEELLHPATEDALRRLNILTNEFKMDPAFMKHVNEAYGPLEWRLPEAHAIYWSARGLTMASNNPTRVNPQDLIQLSRGIYHSMQMSFRRGRLMSSPFSQGIETGPNVDIIPRVNASYEEAMTARDEEYRNNIAGGHRNFLRDAVIFLYSANRVADAAKWYQYLVTKYPDKPLIENDINSLPKNVTLEQFVTAQIMIDVTETDRDKVKARIEEFLAQGFLFMVRGERDLAAGYRMMARNLWTSYTTKIGPGVGQERIGLPPMDVIEPEVLKRLLDPQEGLQPELRAILRTEMGLGAEPVATGTNAPATTVSPTNSPAGSTNASVR